MRKRAESVVHLEFEVTMIKLVATALTAMALPLFAVPVSAHVTVPVVQHRHVADTGPIATPASWPLPGCPWWRPLCSDGKKPGGN